MSEYFKAKTSTYSSSSLLLQMLMNVFQDAGGSSQETETVSIERGRDRPPLYAESGYVYIPQSISAQPGQLD